MKLPLTIFPTNILLIDDDIIYADLISQNMLNQEGLSISPIKEINTLIKQGENDFIFLPYKHTNSNNNKHLNSRDIRIKLENTVSVIAADFYMGDVNGLEFFKQIRSPFIYKILISNFIDFGYSKEINIAVNNGVIHAVLDKKHNFQKELKSSVNTGLKRFFSLLSSDFSHSDIKSKVSDIKLAEFIWNTIEKIKPSYMESNDQCNMFKFYGADHEVKNSLFITTREDVNLLIDGYQAETASIEIMDKLKSNMYIIASEDPYSIEGERWGKYIRPAQEIIGNFNEYLVGFDEVVNE